MEEQAKQPITRLDDIIDQKWSELSEKMRSIYGAKKTYAKQFIVNGGLTDWIESLRGRNLDRMETNLVAATLFRFGAYEPTQIHSQLVHICRQKDVELPAVEGILTEAFWVAHFSKKRYVRVV